MRGALIWLGCADPVATLETLAVADPVRENRAEVYRAMAELPDIGDGMRTADLIKAAEDDEALHDAFVIVGRGKDGSIDSAKLAGWLRRSINVTAAGYKLTQIKTDKQRPRWRLLGKFRRD